jgi:hypothetical protein
MWPWDLLTILSDEVECSSTDRVFASGGPPGIGVIGLALGAIQARAMEEFNLGLAFRTHVLTSDAHGCESPLRRRIMGTVMSARSEPWPGRDHTVGRRSATRSITAYTERPELLFRRAMQSRHGSAVLSFKELK